MPSAKERGGAPRHPGAILKQMLAYAPELNQARLAERLGVSRPRLNELLRGRRAITPDTALRLARLLGVPAEYWMTAQARWDLHALAGARGMQRELERIEPFATLDEQHEIPPDFLPSSYLMEFLEQRGLLESARRYARYRAAVDRLAAPRPVDDAATAAPAPPRAR